MKLFKWHLIDDIELRCFENGLIKELKQRLDISEKDNWDKYLKIEKLEKELQQKENIIKEVREYIKENSIYYPTSDGCQWVDQFKVLEILDKGE